MPVGSIGPAHRGDGDRVMAEVHKDVNVLPVVEGVGVLRFRALNEPGRHGTESGPRRQNQDTDGGWERAALGEVSHLSSESLLGETLCGRNESRNYLRLFCQEQSGAGAGVAASKATALQGVPFSEPT